MPSLFLPELDERYICLCERHRRHRDERTIKMTRCLPSCTRPIVEGTRDRARLEPQTASTVTRDEGQS